MLLASEIELESGEGAGKRLPEWPECDPNTRTYVTCSCGCAPDTGQSFVFVRDEYSYCWVTSSLISASPELLVCITNPWWSCRSHMLRSPDCTPLPAQNL